MFLDVENQFSIISPTHDFKLVTRLQHVTQAVHERLAERPRKTVWLKHFQGDDADGR